MKIIAPVSNVKETEEIIRAGADEIYCGVIPDTWIEKYPVIISPNKRASRSLANLRSFDDLAKVVSTAHYYNVPVRLALNAFYSQKQRGLIYEQIEHAIKSKVDALIVSDLGLLRFLKREGISLDIHLSTAGTTFNSQAVKFYSDLGVSNIVLPRYLSVDEIQKIAEDFYSFKFEIIILGSGCKNIDGFCMFFHGINEISQKMSWRLASKLNLYYHFTNLIKKLPKEWFQRMTAGISDKSDACLLKYKVSSPSHFVNNRIKRFILGNIKKSINDFSHCDACGACRLLEFYRAGVHGVKMAGRTYPTVRKVRDVLFLKTLLYAIENRGFEKKEFYQHTREVFHDIYKSDCFGLCYYPDGM
ncbi:hypothetical protein EPO66_05555 [bacterium]|nr:MAG: hypothetical protein EPO66_05555 [bacterium]